MSSTVSTIAPTQPPTPSTVSVPESARPVSEMIDATETLYRLTAAEYEQIAGFLDDDRVELIDGFLVKKMGKNPPHVVVCTRLSRRWPNALRSAGTRDPGSRYGSGCVPSQNPTPPWRVAPLRIMRTAIPNRQTSLWSPRLPTRR